jgi:hypothetical protein
MTTVKIIFRYTVPSTEAVSLALANTRKVYGIRWLRYDRATHTLHVEYDATRLSAAVVRKLIRQAGLGIDAEQLPLQYPTLEHTHAA